MDQGFQPGRATTPATKIELIISCKNLRNRDTFSKSDPFCVVFLKEFGGSRFSEVGRTEILDNTLNPEFSQRIPIDYKFEESQSLRFEVYDSDANSPDLKRQDFLGRLECTLGEIVGAKGSKIQRNLTGLPGQGCGTIIISAEELEASKEIFSMQWRGEKLDKKDFFGKSDPFIQIYRIDDDGSALMIHRTEVIKNTLNPVWKPFRLAVGKMTNGNSDRTLRFDVYDWDNDGGHDLIGVFETRVSKLRQAVNSNYTAFELINSELKAKKKGYRNSGTLVLASFSVETDYTFLDYVRGGTQLNFTVAVDFTASNGNPTDPNSLHYIHPTAPNAYMIALKAVGEICQDYDSDKLFPALGFGARLPPNGVVSHEFFLNFNPSNPHCYRVEGILEAYKRCLLTVQLYGPTNFSPVINHVAKIASTCMDGSNYFILLIITDGVISDMDQTIGSIVNASYLPMSIIIVGVGNADFSAMDFLDADRGALVSQGRRAERDIVQFVPMNKYISLGNFMQSQAQLAKDVLAEVPLQLTSYMRMRGIKPRPPIQISTPPLAPEPTGFSEPQQPGAFPPSQPQQQWGPPSAQQQQQQPGSYPQQRQMSPAAPQPGLYPSVPQQPYAQGAPSIGQQQVQPGQQPAPWAPTGGPGAYPTQQYPPVGGGNPQQGAYYQQAQPGQQQQPPYYHQK